MSSSFVSYIDESGDEGFKFAGGSSEWFVLAGVVTRKSIDLATVKLIDKVKADLKRQVTKPLHFKDLRHEHRVPYVTEISKAPIVAAAVLVHKPSIHSPAVFTSDSYRLYRYTVRYLLERLSWYCRDNHDAATYGGDGGMDIVFSNRSRMSYDDIRDYLRLLQSNPAAYGCRINWTAVRPERISTLQHAVSRGLQIADAVASSYGYAVNASKFGYTEPRYIETLKPIIYCNNTGCYLGHGLKIWPAEVEPKLATDENLKWIKEHFGG